MTESKKILLKVSPASLVFSDFSLNAANIKEICSRQWYDVFSIKEKSENTRDAGDTFKSIFFDSVNLRLRSDVPVGSCLSGGIDSSAIVSVLGELFETYCDIPQRPHQLPAHLT